MGIEPVSGESAETRRADWVVNRDALIAAAAALYAERGIGVSLEQVAQRAGVGRATLYRHFPQRADLRFAVIERIVEGMELAAAERPDAPGTFRSVLTVAVRLQREALPITELLGERGARAPEYALLRERARRALGAPLAAAQGAGVVSAETDAEDVLLALTMLAGVIRPETSVAEQRRAWRLTEAALGMTGA